MGSQSLVDVLKACADETRIRIIEALGREGDLCVGDLVSLAAVSQPKMSRHLAYLKRAGVVKDRKEGLKVYYRLSLSLDPQAAKIIEAIAQSPRRPEPPHPFDDSLGVELL